MAMRIIFWFSQRLEARGSTCWVSHANVPMDPWGYFISWVWVVLPVGGFHSQKEPLYNVVHRVLVGVVFWWNWCDNWCWLRILLIIGVLGILLIIGAVQRGMWGCSGHCPQVAGSGLPSDGSNSNVLNIYTYRQYRRSGNAGNIGNIGDCPQMAESGRAQNQVMDQTVASRCWQL